MTAYPFQDTKLPAEERARDLAGRMTLDEKVSQMLHDSPAIERLGIPAHNWWNECLHGVARAGIATVFPQAIGLAATFDTRLMHRVATAISDEARAKHHANAERGERGIYRGLTFWTPNINIFRDPRWGRGQETYGECPFLTGRMGVAFVRGLQGDDPRHLKVIATPKHLAVHSGPEKGRHGFNATVGNRDLRETYLPAFRDCVIEARAASVMGAYNRTNGEVCCGSPTLLQRILRGEWGFGGYVVSDCGAVEDFHEHHRVTASPEQSAALAVRNGCDLNCGCVYGRLVDAAMMGLISEEQVDRSLVRLLAARMRLGVFDPPDRVAHTSIPFDVVDSEPHRELALEAARESLVLLRNEGELLPLDPAIRTLAVIGPNADDRAALLGNYHGTPSRFVTPLEGIRARVSPGTRVLYQPGCEHIGPAHPAAGAPDRMIPEALHAVARADAVVLVLGLTGLIEGEEGDAPFSDAGGDRTYIGLPPIQQRLLEAVVATGKPVVLVVLSGSAVSIPWAAEHVPAIIQQFYPGQSGGAALAEALFGDTSPAGRLPVTVVRDIAQLPPFDDYSMEGRTYRFMRGEPLYPFGFGLAYSRFEYGAIRLEKESLVPGDDLAFSVEVRNAGPHDADEVVQAYLEWRDAPVRTPLLQLVAFERVRLAAGKSQRVAMSVRARSMAFVDGDGSHILGPGHLTLHAGGSQPDPRSRALGAAETVSAYFHIAGDTVILEP